MIHTCGSVDRVVNLIVGLNLQHAFSTLSTLYQMSYQSVVEKFTQQRHGRPSCELFSCNIQIIAEISLFFFFFKNFNF